MASNVSHPLPSAQAHTLADLGFEDADTLSWQHACVQAANTLTALPNGRYVSVRMERMRQGLELAQRGAVTLAEDSEQLSATVRSGNNLYQVDTRLLTCTCADYQKHLQACKHLLAVEVHLGALGLLPPSAPEPAVTFEPEAPLAEPICRAPGAAALPPLPTTATWPTSEAPASLNVKLRLGQGELMYTMRDVDDDRLRQRASALLPWLREVLGAFQAAEPKPQPPAPQPAPLERTLEEQVAATTAAAMKAQANGTPPPRAPQLEPTNDTNPSRCPIHRCTMERKSNEWGHWWSHYLGQDANGKRLYCKGE